MRRRSVLYFYVSCSWEVRGLSEACPRRFEAGARGWADNCYRIRSIGIGGLGPVYTELFSCFFRKIQYLTTTNSHCRWVSSLHHSSLFSDDMDSVPSTSSGSTVSAENQEDEHQSIVNPHSGYNCSAHVEYTQWLSSCWKEWKAESNHFNTSQSSKLEFHGWIPW